MTSNGNQLIAKNTLMLYFRMILTMLVSLYTSRVVLSTLGVEDYGIYNVVSGFVTMFGFLNNSMSRATQRFLTFEIGRENYTQLRNVFSMSLNIHYFIAFVVFLFAELIGMWFFNNQLNVPSDRMYAARWVYQLSILSLMVNIISVPYNAMIIAYERMNIFAWVSIVEVSLKLLIVFMLQLFGFDKLILYAILILIVSLAIRLIYAKYCDAKFKESKFRWYWDKEMFKVLLSFAGWNLWGNIASVLTGQGVNILLNIYFGPVVNAARGIAFQIKGAIISFVQNFQMALNPQIIKSFAINDITYMHQLTFQGSKFSFYLLLILSLPVLFETEFILNLWLKVVPDYTIVFTRLIILNILIDSISGPLMTAAQATGKIKLYQGVVGGVLLLNLPLSYVFLIFGYSPETTFIIGIFISIIALFIRLIILQKIIRLKIIDFFTSVIFKLLIVTIVSIIPPMLICSFLDESIMRIILVTFLSIFSSIITIYFLGLTVSERDYTIKILRKFQIRFF